MYTNGFMGFFYKFSDWFVKLAYINILWILFSLFGLIVIGFFPATFAMFSVIRRVLNKEDLSIFKAFLKSYTGDFLKSNLIGWFIILVFSILYFDLTIIEATENDFFQFFQYPLLIIGFLFFATVLYVIPTYIHYDLKLFELFKNSFVIMIVNPLNTITMISTIFVIYFVSYMIPGIIPFFSGSLLTLFLMMAALRSFQKIEDSKDRLETKA
ncbi:YesL family protein [Oceanobacillus longus]|uniref:YesL family protein n=1 Tax=Oceanobacillus longus TaxID=930120 RepID=A0ABV8H1H7_9BACI